MGSGFVFARAEGRVTGTGLQCFVLGGSSLLQGRAADVAREARLASCERQEKKVGCSAETLTQKPKLVPGATRTAVGQPEPVCSAAVLCVEALQPGWD